MFELIQTLLQRALEMVEQNRRLGKTSNQEDKLFTDHIEANLVWYARPVVIVGMICILTIFAQLPYFSNGILAASMITNLGNLHVFTTVLTFFLFSTLFSWIWHSVYTRYVARISKERISGSSPKRLAVSAIFLPMLAFVMLSFLPAQMLSATACAYFFVLTSAMMLALWFSIHIQAIVKSGLSKSVGMEELLSAEVLPKFTLQDTSPNTILEFKSIDNLSFGWFGTNLISLAFLLVYSLILLFDLLFFDMDFHNYFLVMNDGKEQQLASVLGNGAFFARSTVEFLFLLTFATMGFFSGRFRTKIDNSAIKAEIYFLNLLLSMDDGSNTRTVGGSEGLQPTNGGPEAPSPNPVVTMVQGLASSSRLLPSFSSAAFLLVYDGNVLSASMFFMFLCVSFLFNDICDYVSGKDKVCHPNRALPSKKISVDQSFKTIGLLLLAMFWSLTLFGEFTLLLAYLGAVVGSAVYSLALKPLFPAFATPFWCFTVTYVFFLNSTVGLGLWISFFLIMFGRELLLDLRDIQADKLFIKRMTIPMILGAALLPASILMMSAGVGIYALSMGWEIPLVGLLFGASVLLLGLLQTNQCLLRSATVAWFLVVFTS